MTSEYDCLTGIVSCLKDNDIKRARVWLYYPSGFLWVWVGSDRLQQAYDLIRPIVPARFAVAVAVLPWWECRLKRFVTHIIENFIEE